MPQATRELQLKWDHDARMDGKAIEHLCDRGFTFGGNGLIYKPKNYTPTEDDLSAIDYLCQEWDYGYEG